MHTVDQTLGAGDGTFTSYYSTSGDHVEEFFPYQNDDPSFYRKKRFKEGWDTPKYVYGRIGFTLSLGIGLQLTYNIGEDLDLVLGFLGIDIFDDDMYSKLEKEENEQNANQSSSNNTYTTKVDYESILNSAQTNYDSEKYKKASELASYVVVNGDNSSVKSRAKKLARRAILKQSFQEAANELRMEE